MPETTQQFLQRRNWQQARPVLPFKENPNKAALREKIRQCPHAPGVYRFLDAQGKLLYVGKAKNLRKRLLSHLTTKPDKTGVWKRGLYERMADIGFIVTGSELKALALEMRTIIKERPPYNVHMKRSKDFAYVRISMSEDFPSVFLRHDCPDDGALYYGPFTNVYSQRRMLEVLRSVLGFRNCPLEILIKHTIIEAASGSIPLELQFRHRDRPVPCMDMHVGKCAAPCARNMSPETYRRECIEPVTDFYEGNHGQIIGLLTARLKNASGEDRFLRAAEIRDTLKFIKEIEHQKLLFA